MWSLSSILGLLSHNGYLLVFIIGIIEGPIITILAGFLAAQHYFSMYALFLLFIVADFVGDIPYYAIGKYAGSRWIKKWAGWFGIDEAQMETVAADFNKHDIKLLLFAKTQAIGGIFLAAAGFARMNFWRFSIINALGDVIKVPAFLVIGYYFGYPYMSIDGYIGKIAVISTALVVVASMFLFRKVYSKKK